VHTSILKSWKEVSIYLKVSVRTAQRWKNEFGLPVRRMEGKHESGILAFPDEIEEWLKNRLNRTEDESVTAELQNPPAELDEVLITEQLWKRPWRPPTYDREFVALRTLARSMVQQEPKDVLNTVSELAIDLCKAGSSGFSLLEEAATGKHIFRLVALAGRMQNLEGRPFPRHFNPSDLCLERNSPQLFYYPEKHYTFMRSHGFPRTELLCVPVYGRTYGIGTIWVACHEQPRKFDREDVRILESLAEIATGVLAQGLGNQNASEKKTEKPKAFGKGAGS